MASMGLTEAATLPADGYAGALAGRVWRPDVDGPSVVAVRADGVYDVSATFATIARSLRGGRPRRRACGAAQGERLGSLADDPRQHAARGARCRQALAARADRPASDQGRGRDLRDLDAGARDRGARARRPRRGRAHARRDDRADRRGPRRRLKPGSPAAQKLKEALIARGRLVAISRGRHRPGRGNLHQVAADVGGRRGRGRGVSLGVALEQSRARGGARSIASQRRDRRRDARQRRQPARFRGPQRAAARQGEGPERELRDRPVPAPVRRRPSPRRRARDGDLARRSRARTASGWRAARRCARSAAIPPISRRQLIGPQPRLSRRRGVVPGHDVRAGRRPRRAGQGLHPQARRRRRRQRRQARAPGQPHAARALMPALEFRRRRA